MVKICCGLTRRSTVVDKSTHHAKAHSIWFFFYHNLCQDTRLAPESACLHYANELLVHVRLSCQKLYKLAQYAETIRKNVWEKSDDAYLLSIRVQTTINHISICFFTTISPSKKKISEHELKKALQVVG